MSLLLKPILQGIHTGGELFLQIPHIYPLITQQIISDIGEEVGMVWKKWPGFNEEQNMDHEYFGLNGESVVLHIFLSVLFFLYMYVEINDSDFMPISLP